eukprot:scaffold287894_cov13-Tisochrysis_lutea.AAC.1
MAESLAHCIPVSLPLGSAASPTHDCVHCTHGGLNRVVTLPAAGHPLLYPCYPHAAAAVAVAGAGEGECCHATLGGLHSRHTLSCPPP